ncbi:hypothetical protein DFH06DRAFT_913433, partial [Mycena polygramma]
AVNTAYLVEPLRSSTVVEKFSGTIGGSEEATNKLTGTMCAFTHYVLEKTACRLAFTDLQGWCRFADIRCFTDCHMSFSETGVGDHGPDGIEDTIKSHICSFMRKSMKLANAESLQATFEAEKE